MIKTKKLYKSTFLFVLICVLSLLPAQTTNVGKTSAPFLSIGVGSRAMGMGGAFVATANDASAMYWNPAGIAYLENIEAIFVHTDWLAELDANPCPAYP